MTHKEMTKQIRESIKRNSIKARVRKYTACGINYIQIFTPTHESFFNAKDIKIISSIAKVYHLTGSGGSEIDPIHEALLTGKQTWDFEFHNNV